jgi:cellulose synthase/poly-beta-1,6-N-acetylglucosamine synthase-like glycosyltransferase
MIAPATVLVCVSLALLVSAGAAIYTLFQGYEVLRRLLREAREDDSLLLKSPLAPGISVISAPAGASPESRAAVRRLLDLQYGNREVVVVLDGVEPLERDRWLAEFRLGAAPRKASGELPSAAVRGIYESSDPIDIVLVDKEPGGKADALNAAVNVARFPVICWVEPDSRFGSNLLLRLIRPMLEQPEETVAVCGVAPALSSGGLAGRLSATTFVRNWLVRCAAFAGWNRLLPVPGAAVLVRRDAIVAARGFRAGIAEMCLRLHAAARTAKADYRVALVPDPVITPAEVSSWRALWREIARDQAGFARLSTRWTRGTGMKTRAGVLWYLLIQPLVETAGCALALGGWTGGWIDSATALFFLISSAGAGIVVSSLAVVLPALAAERETEPKELKRLFVTAVIENLGYRQIRNLLLVWGFFGKEA